MGQIPDDFLPGADFPETMGQCVDLYAKIRAIRLAMEKEVKPFKDRENELKEHMIQNIAKSRKEGKDTGAAGKFYRVQIRDKEITRINDWPSFYKFVAKTGRFDLLQKRHNDKPVLELMMEDEDVPGAEVMLIPDVSITKI